MPPKPPITAIRFLMIASLVLTFGFNQSCSNPKPDFSAHLYELDNHARLVYLPSHRWPLITHMVWYPVGAGDEKKGKTGLAHFLEHLFFQHEPHLKNGGFARLVAKMGGRDNAFTSYDYTAYFQHIHPNQLEEVMKLESERLQALDISDHSAQKERQVVIEELLTRLASNPISHLRDKMRAHLYGRNHPYGRDVIGFLDDIKKLTAKDALDFYREFYHPQNAIIVIAGDVSAKKAYQLAQTYYGQLAPLKERKPLLKDFPHIVKRQSAKAIVIHRDKKTRQALFARDYVLANRHLLGAKRAASLEVLTEILARGEQSRLYRTLVSDKKIASFVQAYIDLNRRGPGQLSLKIWPAGGQKKHNLHLKHIHKSIDEIFEDLRKTHPTQPITKDEITQAKNRLLAQSIYLNDNLYQLASLVGAWLASDYPLKDAQDWSKQIEQVDEESIQDAIHYMLNPSRAITGFLLPQKGVSG